MTNFVSNHRSYDVRDINHTYSKYKSDMFVHWISIYTQRGDAGVVSDLMSLRRVLPSTHLCFSICNTRGSN